MVPPPGQQKTVPIPAIGVKLTGEMQIYGLRLKHATGDFYSMFESPDGNCFAHSHNIMRHAVLMQDPDYEEAPSAPPPWSATSPLGGLVPSHT